jgi:hypothetical protein
MTELLKNTQVPQCDKTAVSRSVILVPMTDFVLQNAYTNEIVKDFHSVLIKHCKYAEFLNQPLKIEMFIPYDKKEGVLEDITGQGMIPYYLEKVHRFLTAQQKVLFDGFSVFKRKDYYVLLADDYPRNHEIWVSWNESKTVQDLLYLSPKLTKIALDVLGLSDSV